MNEKDKRIATLQAEVERLTALSNGRAGALNNSEHRGMRYKAERDRAVELLRRYRKWSLYGEGGADAIFSVHADTDAYLEEVEA
jgi:hypothetical protein